MKARPAHMLIASIRRDGGTQIRAALDEATVVRYADALKAKVKLPPETVFYDGTDHWMADGFHRVEARLRCGEVRATVDVVSGTRRDAILHACGANAEHGLPRSNADKRRAVETILGDDEWSSLPDRTVARLVKVSHHLVAEVRESIRMRCGVAGNSPISTSVSHIGNNSDLPARALGSPQGPGDKADAGMASGSGDEGEGAEVTGNADVPPVADEPRLAMDTLGLELSGGQIEQWVALEAALSSYDNHLRAAQAALTPLFGQPVGNALIQLRQETHELAARARKSLTPRTVCPYCKDGDGTLGRRVNCNGCHNRGFLTEDQLSAVPAELKAKGDAAKVIDQKAGGYVPRPRALKVELVDEAGVSTPFEDETNSGGEW